MSRTLIIVDMQNDFITGSLANPAAQAIVKPICEYIEKSRVYDDFDNVILTRDTHKFNYLETPEGKALPVEHCIEGTAGWCIVDEIQKSLKKVIGGYGKADHPVEYTYVDKPTFGYTGWGTKGPYVNNDARYSLGDEIVVVGTCTDICVISNVLILKATFPEKKITVMSHLCAGLTPEKHNAALEVMRSCQVEVI